MNQRCHTPLRSCVACGQRAPQAELARFIADGPVLRLDRGTRQPGRGAYLHRASTCWDIFVARKAPIRSLRRAIDRPLRLALVDELREAATR